MVQSIEKFLGPESSAKISTHQPLARPGRSSIDDFLGPPPQPTIDAFLGAPPLPSAETLFAPLPSAETLFAPPKPRAEDLFGAQPAAPQASPWTPETVNRYAGPGTISSARRSAAQNARVGGSPTSSHLTGSAFDFVPADGDTARAAKALAAAGLGYDQIIDEGDHVHIGWGPKMRGQFKPRNTLVADSIDAFLGPAKNAVSGADRRRQEAQALMASGAEDFRPNADGSPKGPMSSLVGAGKMAGGAFSYLAAPIAGAVEGLVGTPVETATGGGLSKEGVGDISESLIGFLPFGPKGAKPRAPEGTAYRAAARPKAGSKPLAEDIFAPGPVDAATAAKPVAEELFPVAPKPKAVAAQVEDPYDDLLVSPAKRRPPSTPVPALEPVTPRGVKEGLADVGGAVRALLAPATIREGYDAAGVIRHRSAEGDLMAARTGAALAKHAKQLSRLSEPQQLALIDYLQRRSAGALIPNTELQPFADTHRRLMGEFEESIGRALQLDEVNEGPFLQDYYAQMWRETGPVVEGQILQNRQGSGRSLKARSIPTVADGIAAGLTPVTTNPLEMDMLYATNMGRFLATVNVQKDLMADGLAAFHAVDRHPAGWEPLKGIRARKPGRVIIRDGELAAVVPDQQLYAPKDVARVYNNWISPGFERGDIKPLFEVARRASNGMVQLKLGLSAFHAVTMAQEAMISELARGVQAVSRAPGLAARGRVGEAGEELGRGALDVLKSPGQFVGYARRGDRLQKELLDLAPPDGMSAAVNDAFIRAGGRIRMDPLYRTRGAGSFYNSLHNGTWKRELKDTADKMFGKDRLVSERAKAVVDLGANIIQSTAAPLFEYYIPRVKQGAFASSMEDWLRRNPAATQKQIDEAAHLINRSIDNRFGEMAWDNLFWHRYLKQASQILLLSPTWNLGTINEIGGGLVDMLGPSAKGLVSGQGLTPRTAYIAAAAAQVALMNGVATYLKTGTAPEGMDFLVYRTGGTDATSGEPERALTPGYQKDIYAFAHDFPNHIGQEIKNKLNPALKTALELGTNKDYRGLPIRPGEGAVVAEGDAGLDDYLLEAFLPISLAQLRKGQKEGSNISPAEQFLAIRPASSYMQSPERTERLKKLRERREWQRKRRADLRDKAMRGQ